MVIDTRSELTVDVENSIAMAYDTSLSKKEKENIRAHLAFILPKLKKPNTLIEPVLSALLAIKSQIKQKSWLEKLFIYFVLPLAVILLATYAAHKLGWNKSA